MSGTGDKRFDELLSAYLNSSLNREESGEFVELLQSHAKYKEKYDRAVKQHARILLPRFEQRKADNYKKLSEQLGFGHTRSKKLYDYPHNVR